MDHFGLRDGVLHGEDVSLEDLAEVVGTRPTSIPGPR
jgi:hypothetical protein